MGGKGDTPELAAGDAEADRAVEARVEEGVSVLTLPDLRRTGMCEASAATAGRRCFERAGGRTQS